MLSELRERDSLEQSVAAEEIEMRFGSDLLYINDNGNLAIEQEVLDAFRELTGNEVVWDRPEFLWRYREDADPSDSRAAY